MLTLKAEENVWDDEAKLEEEKEHVKINKDKTFLVDSIASLASTDVTMRQRNRRHLPDLPTRYGRRSGRLQHLHKLRRATEMRSLMA